MAAPLSPSPSDNQARTSCKKQNVDVTLLYIYDKSKIGNVSDRFTAYLLKQ